MIISSKYEIELVYVRFVDRICGIGRVTEPSSPSPILITTVIFSSRTRMP